MNGNGRGRGNGPAAGPRGGLLGRADHLTLAGVTVLVLVYLLAVGLPQWRELSRTSRDIRRIKSDLRRAAQDIAEAARYRADFARLEAEGPGRARTLLRGRGEVPRLLEAITAEARRSDVTIDRIAPSGEAEARGAGLYEEIPILVKASSDYDGLVRFLQQLGRAQRSVRVRDIVIRSLGASSTRHAVNLVLVAYARAGGG